ncbi:unnamed protein product [Aureobasidium uvarum]|uniref:J domain-containing protein n=1 Tax=Aureobasidium uvarum TaxID=2773716 RepID=A0A9N8PP30_9PEZI|nr:unnamed protein product [Aureobasidium uvarum]
MVKADIKRNYYADLELPNDASVEDIKKAYRKLESEIVPKFQAIQAAHEILHDPVSKTRYDADRRKAGLGGGAFTKPNVPPRSTGTNPMYQATSNFPPPPRRTPAPTSTWRSTASGASGADRFTNFPRPAPTSKKNPADPANVFNAWQNMKPQTPGTAPQPPPRASPKRPVPRPPPRQDTRYPTEEDIRAGMNYREAPPKPANAYDGFRSARSAWAEYNSAGTSKADASASSSIPRKGGGFDPTSTGDERQAGNTANYSSSRRKSADPPYYPPPPPRSASQRDYSDVPAEDARTRAAYSGEDARRTASTPHVPMASDGASQFRRSTRKAGTGTARKPFVVYSSSDDSETEDDSASTTPDTAQKKSQSATTDQPADPFSRSFTRPKKTPNPPSRQFKFPYKAPGEASGSSNTGPDAAADAGEKDKPTMYANHFSTPPSNKQEKMPSPVYPFGRTYQQNKSPDSIPRWAVPSSVPPVKRSHSAAQRAWIDLTNTETSANAGKSQPNSRRRPPQMPLFDDLVDLTADDTPELQSPYKKTCFTKDDATGLFTIPINADTFRPNMAKSRSEDSINTSFVPEQWAGDFTSNNVFAAAQATAGRKSATPSRKSSRAFRQQSRTNTFSEHTTQQNQAEATQDPTMPSPPPPPAKYSPEEWAKHFQDATWAFDPNTLRTSSPGKPESRTTSRSNSAAVRKGSRVANKIPVNTPKPATVTDETEESVPRTHSPDEMDVDDAPPANTPAPTQTTSVQEPRIYPVDTNNLRRNDTESNKRESSGFNVKLDDLGAAVDAPPSQGLDGLADISSTLPFTSKASTTIPTFTPQNLVLPPLPRAPSTPTKLTRASWSTYCTTFSVYLDKFNKYNAVIVAHFSSRQDLAAKVVKAGIRALEAVGEASTGEGFMSYAQAVKEDERVREHWNVGCERHADAVKEFEAVRERVRVLSQGAGLPEN